MNENERPVGVGDRLRGIRAATAALLVSGALLAGSGVASAAEVTDVRVSGSYRVGGGPWKDVGATVIRVPIGARIEVRPTMDADGNLVPGKCAGSDGIRHQTALWFHASCTA